MKVRLVWIVGVFAACGGAGEPVAGVVVPTNSVAVNVDAGGPIGDAALVDAGGVESGARDADVAVPAPSGCVGKVSAGHHLFACAGLTYDVEISGKCAAGGCGLVLDVHGLTMNGDQEERSTKLRVVGAGHGGGYVVVQPTAAAGLIGPSWDPATDDDKVWGFLEDVRRALLIDEHRIHVTGFSQGGAMSWRLLCKHADVIASAAPIAAADAKTLDSNVPPFRLDCPFDAKSAPSRPLSILQMHGTKDGLVPIAKGKLQRDAVLAWLGPVVESQVAGDDDFTHTRFTSASKNVVFEFIEHDYKVEAPLVPLLLKVAGHCFPGGADLRGASGGAGLYFSCAPPNAFVWADVVMSFFAAHPRP